ncbi:uncharacterized protein LOC130258039 [Oenanthe melanoleuca]|uniref:uncharacterized protein LOC130258039 n=1 Tax=Oenanthe melanoleuca TaxID=2939378 RepID=UPI0024C107A1|nr:uncharacterized protein LOC130258039 [Oenanthe melanoleuca]
MSFLQVSHLVKVTLESSPYFQLVGPNDVYRKVPPGLSKAVRILFTPGQNKDYFHRLVCVTEREELIVPIRAIGARAILQFPDQLDFSQCTVKYITQKTVLLSNAGNREAHFQLSTQRFPGGCWNMLVAGLHPPGHKQLLKWSLTTVSQTDPFSGRPQACGFPVVLSGDARCELCCGQPVLFLPFSVIPATGTLGIGDSMQVTVGFLPMWTGDYSTTLVMHYDTVTSSIPPLSQLTATFNKPAPRSSETAQPSRGPSPHHHPAHGTALNTSSAGTVLTSPVSPVQCLSILLGRNSSKCPPLTSSRAALVSGITCHLGEEPDPHLAPLSFQVVGERYKVTPD